MAVPGMRQKEVRPVTVQHTSRIKHDGRLHTVELPRFRVPQCRACGELVFDNDADEQIAQALREQLGLLSGDQIRRNREALGLSQRVLAEHLGVAMETISRWENSALTQTRAMDRYLASTSVCPPPALHSWNRLRFPSWEFASQRNDPLPDTRKATEKPDTHVLALASGPARPVTCACHPSPEGDVAAHPRPPSPSRHRHHPPQV